MKEQLESSELAHIWHSQLERDIKRLQMIIRERCNDTEKQKLFLQLHENISLLSYHQEMKH
jgi:hypothetical protein